MDLHLRFARGEVVEFWKWHLIDPCTLGVTEVEFVKVGQEHSHNNVVFEFGEAHA